MSQAPIAIEVVFALPQEQCLVALRVPAGTTAGEAVRRSGLAAAFPGHDIVGAPLGIFGEPVTEDFVLEAGDRVEIYRPLSADPRKVRRDLARVGKTMGKRNARRDPPADTEGR